MAYEIIDGLPLPENPKEAKYPFSSMAVGQAFLIPAAEVAPNSTLHRLRRAVSNWKRKQDRRDTQFAIREMEDGSLGVWRLA